MAAEKTPILLIGATGYIGGSVLTSLIDTDIYERYALSALVRKPYQASILADAGVNPLIFKELDDFEVIREAAKECDIVINAANARHEGCVKACLAGLSERRKVTDRNVHYIHVSGTSMIGDWPITGKRIDTAIHSDIDENIHELEQNIPEDLSPVRRVNQLVVSLGLEEGVRTYIVPPPLIFGPGTGFFTLGVGQVHMLAQLALQKRQAVMIGAGTGIWNRVHISDLSNLFSLLVAAIVDSKVTLPHGKSGYYFAENGLQTWERISERIGQTGKAMGLFEEAAVGEISLQEAADVFYNGDMANAEAVLASNSRTKADRARSILGWEPKHGEESFLEEIDDVVAAMFTNPDD